jgi:hypothetical protein
MHERKNVFKQPAICLSGEEYVLFISQSTLWLWTEFRDQGFFYNLSGECGPEWPTRAPDLSKKFIDKNA